MHRVWKNLSSVDLNYFQEHLWIQMFVKDNGDVNIFGTGTFKIFAKEGEKLVAKDDLKMAVDAPNRVVYHQQDIPALTTIEIFDSMNKMLFHLISEETVEIR
jgi:hypothetical protein